MRRFKLLKNKLVKPVGRFSSQLLLSAFLSASLGTSVSAMDKIDDKKTAVDQSSQFEWQKISTGTATWMWLDIYEASLYAAVPILPKEFLSDEVPLKLHLCYLKSISSDIFIEGASEVLPNDLTPSLHAEVDRLHQAYQSVEPGDCYTLEYTTYQGTVLKLNGKPIFHSNEMGFKAVYFGIWLGNNPLSEALKRRLLTTKFAKK